MTPERWKEINRIFRSAVVLDPSERDGYLDDACSDDRELRDQVKSLLEADDEADGFISGNAGADHPDLIEETETPDVPGKMIGHYEVISVIGRGGMGKVYLVHDPKLHRDVALKTFPSSMKGWDGLQKRFETEAKAAANISHPNVATVYSVEETDDNRTFMTMEYVKGQLLGELIPPGGVELSTFLEWFVPITDALSAAHETGVIHRDIKPGNIMITEEGVPKILDFGLARIERGTSAEAQSMTDLTKPGQVIGTPAYMSPEQAEGSQIDFRTDIFSLGVVMYQAITGRRPFTGDNYASIVSKLLTLDPPQVAAIRPGVPPMLSRLIMKCLSRDARFRYKSMAELRVILEEIRSAHTSGASLPSHVTKVAPSRTTPSRLPALLGGAAIMLVLCGIAAALWYATSESEVTPTTKFSLEPPPGQELSLFETALSQDGRKLVFATRRTDLKNLFVRSMDEFSTVELAGTEDARKPFFSPDAQWIGYFLEGGTVRKIPSVGGSSLRICDECLSPYEAYWADDDKIIIAGQDGLYSVDPESGKKTEMTRIDEGAGEKAHRAPGTLPDGNVLFTIVYAERVSFAVFDTLAKTVRKIEGVEGTTSSHGGTSLGRFVDGGYLIFGKDGQLMAVRFDPSAVRVDGEPVPVMEGIFAIPNIYVADNGTLAYLPVAESGDNVLVWVDRQGQSTPVFEKRGDYRSPHISPDGSRIVVQVGSDIWVYEIATGRGIRLTFQDENQSPLWSRDGKSIFYATNTGDVWKVHRRSADGNGEPEELLSAKERHLPYSMHPTEPVLALSTVPSANDSDIVMLSLDDRKITPFIKTAFKEDAPKFSPDGRSVAYFSMETGKVQVYIQPWGVAEGTRTPVSSSGGMLPVWARSGNELFFRSGPRLLAVNMAGGGSVPAGNPQLLFDGRYLTGFDVAADGSKFLMIRSEGGTLPKRLNVILNWTDELKSKFERAR